MPSTYRPGTINTESDAALRRLYAMQAPAQQPQPETYPPPVQPQPTQMVSPNPPIHQPGPKNNGPTMPRPGTYVPRPTPQVQPVSTQGVVPRPVAKPAATASPYAAPMQKPMGVQSFLGAAGMNPILASKLYKQYLAQYAQR